MLIFAGMAELADAYGSGPYESNFMQVRPQLPAPRQSKHYIACSDFLYKNQSSLIPLLFLFRKKARSALLFGCKRPHDGSLSLPPFYDIACLWHAKTFDFTPFLHKSCKNNRTKTKIPSFVKYRIKKI